MERPKCIICLEDIHENEEETVQEGMYAPCGFKNTVVMHKQCFSLYENSTDFKGLCPHCNQPIQVSGWNNEIEAMESIQETMCRWLKNPEGRFWRKSKNYFKVIRGRVQRTSQEKRTWRNIISHIVSLMHEYHVSSGSCISVSSDKTIERCKKNITCRNNEKHYEIKISVERVAFYSRTGAILSDGYEISGTSVRLKKVAKWNPF